MPSDDPDSGRDSGTDGGRSPPSDSPPRTDSSPPDSSPPTDPSPPGGAASPSGPSPPRGGRSFVDRLEGGFERAFDHLPLAVVPLISGLLAADDVRRVLDFRGYHVGLTFRFPSMLPDLWTFVSVPNQGPGVHVSPAVFLLPVLIPIRAALVAGLLGSVHQVLRTGEYDFAANARRYFVPVLAFVALVQVLGVLSAGLAALSPPAIVLLFPAFLLLSYLFYATPYLLVVADASVGDALGRSYEWAVAGGPYVAYGGGYLLFVAAVSLVGTAAVVNLGALGVLVGAIATAPVALALTFATAEFVAEMADSADLSAPGRWA